MGAMDDQDIIREFLIESSENLARLDEEIVLLERKPKDADLLASVSRTFHTIKGTCGFLGYSKLEAITHVAENILSQLRNGERDLTPPLVSLLLEAIDAIKQVLRSLEATGEEGEEEYKELRERLRVACEG
jgi:two-component system chemotaxis sensor kinase CheA